MSQTNETKKIQILIKDLESSSDKDKLQAISSIKIHGNETTIEPLVKLYCNTQNETVLNEITKIFNSLKDIKTPKEVVSCLNNKKYQKSHLMLLASVWNSNLDYTDYIFDIVQVATQGDMMAAMECITIIENMEGTLNEAKIFDALIFLKSYLQENEKEQSARMNLLKEVAVLLQEINDSL